MRLPFLLWREIHSARDFLLKRRRTSCAWRPLAAIPKLTDVYLQFVHRPAESVAVHPQLPSRPALVALVLLKDSRDKPPLEFADRF